jgi:hypothetical protein
MEFHGSPPDGRKQNYENGVPQMNTRCQEMQINRPMKTLASEITNSECVNI